MPFPARRRRRRRRGDGEATARRRRGDGEGAYLSHVFPLLVCWQGTVMDRYGAVMNGQVKFGTNKPTNAAISTSYNYILFFQVLVVGEFFQLQVGGAVWAMAPLKVWKSRQADTCLSFGLFRATRATFLWTTRSSTAPRPSCVCSLGSSRRSSSSEWSHGEAHGEGKIAP